MPITKFSTYMYLRRYSLKKKLNFGLLGASTGMHTGSPEYYVYKFRHVRFYRYTIVLPVWTSPYSIEPGNPKLWIHWVSSRTAKRFCRIAVQSTISVFYWKTNKQCVYTHRHLGMTQLPRRAARMPRARIFLLLACSSVITWRHDGFDNGAPNIDT